MKNKGLLITLAVIGAVAIIGAAALFGVFWGRGWFGGGCCGGWTNGNNPTGFGRGMMWGRGTGWFGGGNNWLGAGSASARVLSIEEADEVVDAYIQDFDADEALQIREIMIFDNHAYAIVEEEDTGIAAFEVLVDPDTLTVFPEMGPNMLWNLKYGHMRGGMMGSGYNSSTADMPISDEEALQIANDYLSKNNSDLVAEGHPDRFYGYYTIHTEKNGEVYGMLSVNGYDGEVYLHTWHGEFIEMTAHEEVNAHND